MDTRFWFLYVLPWFQHVRHHIGEVECVILSISMTKPFGHLGEDRWRFLYFIKKIAGSFFVFFTCSRAVEDTPSYKVPLCQCQLLRTDDWRWTTVRLPEARKSLWNDQAVQCSLIESSRSVRNNDTRQIQKRYKNFASKTFWVPLYYFRVRAQLVEASASESLRSKNVATTEACWESQNDTESPNVETWTPWVNDRLRRRGLLVQIVWDKYKCICNPIFLVSIFCK